MPSLRERRPRAQAAYWLILLPAVLMLVALYLVPLADVLLTSVTDPKPGLDNYALLFTSASVQKTLLTTLRIAGITTLLALLLGYLVAYAMRAATSRRQRIMLFCVLLPFWISVLVRSFAWLTLLGGHGVLNGLLIDGGLIDEPLSLVRNETGVLIGMVHVMLPYAILTLYANMLGIDAGLVAAARSLGASRGQAFRVSGRKTMRKAWPDRRRHPGVHPVAGLLRHAGAAGRRQGADGRRICRRPDQRHPALGAGHHAGCDPDDLGAGCVVGAVAFHRRAAAFRRMRVGA